MNNEACEQKSDFSQKELQYQVYLAERKSLIDSEKESSQQFDKTIITLAAGALALSLTFINQISPHPKIWTLYFLFFSWFTFCGSMLSTLISFLTSQAACRKQRQILEVDFCSADQTANMKNNIAIITNRLNYLSIGLFIMGVILLTIFSISNIVTKEENRMSDTKKVVKSQVPPELPKRPISTTDTDKKKAGYVPPSSPKKPPEKKK